MEKENFTMAEWLEAQEAEKAKKLRKGDIVTVKVFQIRDNQFVLSTDAAAGLDGYMFFDQYSSDPEAYKEVKVGDEFEVQVSKADYQGEVMHFFASRKPLLAKADQAKLLEAYNAKEAITVKIKKAIENKGLVAEYYGSELFIPGSLLFAEKGKSFAEYEGKELEVIVAERKVDDKGREKFIGSHKAIAKKEMDEKRAAELVAINVGDVVKGIVTKFEPYGVIVQIGAVRGLLRFGEVSHLRERAEDVLSLNEEVTLKVIAKEGLKLDLSRKALLPSPFAAFTDTNKVSDKVTGKVVQKIGAGLILELAKGVTGLLHRSEFSWNPADNLDMCVKIGDEIEVAILKIDEKANKISLSRKALIDNPWRNVDCKKGDILEVEVVEAGADGVKVIACGVDAVIESRETGLEKNAKVEDYFAKGDKVNAEVIDVFPSKWILKLSIRTIKNREARAEAEKYQEDNNTEDSTIGDILSIEK